MYHRNMIRYKNLIIVIIIVGYIDNIINGNSKSYFYIEYQMNETYQSHGLVDHRDKKVIKVSKIHFLLLTTKCR